MSISKFHSFLSGLSLFTLSICFTADVYSGSLQISKLATLKIGGFGTGAAEIAAYDPQSK